VIRRCVVAGGAGAVGGLFVRQLARSGAQVCIVDPARPDPTGPGVRYRPDDITDPGPELAAELRSADLVLLALPEAAVVAALPGVLRAMRPGAVLADTVSVKHRIAATVGAPTGPARVGGAGPGPADAAGVGIVSLNPMFAPSLGFAGRPVAAVVLRDRPSARELLDLIGGWGARVVQMTAAEHDQLAGATQALTHATILAFGLGLADLGLPVPRLGEVAPPPHATLLALLARIVSGNPAVYWEVQATNPQAERARTALAGGLQRLSWALTDRTGARFAALYDELRTLLGDTRAHYRDRCEQIFAAPVQPPQPAPTPSPRSLRSRKA